MTLIKPNKKKILALVAAMSFCVSAQESTYNDKNALPEIGVVASEAISLDKEMLIGDAVMRQMRGQSPIVNDPVLTEYLQDLGNRLVANADNVKFPFEFFWVNNKAINAFAFFGGHIGVHTGLIYRSENESELASVLAHEVAHVTQRHIARRVLAQQKASPLQLASLLGGLLVAMANPQAGMAAISAGQAAGMQMSLDYTRSNEQEADRIGIAMLARSGFDPEGAATFFGTLAEQYRLVSRPPARLLSHPLTETRIADARSRARSFRKVNLPPSEAFHLARARVKSNYTFSPKYAVEYFEAAVKSKSYAMPQAAQYGLAAAYLKNDEPEKAEAIINTLLEASPENLFYLDTATDVSIALEKYDEAIQRLQAPLALKPRNSTLVLNLSNAYISAERYQDAIATLKDYILVKKDDMLAYQLLSDAYKFSQQLLDMHQANAEVYALYGAYGRSIDELQHAYNFTGDDHLTKQRIRARIKQFRDEQERLKKL